MRRIVVLLAAAAAFAACAAPAEADSVLSPLPDNPFAHFHDGYVNPFADPAWLPARTDMGVDWIPAHKVPLLAIGDAVILGSDSHDTGWPGGHFLWYVLLNGSHAGDIVYVAEHLRNLAPTGRYVRAGQQIATALPGSPYTEWGWATTYGETVAHPCYTEGKKTAAGKEMARFMISLGATVRDQPGAGPDKPQGRRCS